MQCIVFLFSAVVKPIVIYPIVICPKMLSEVLRETKPSDDISEYLEDAISRGEHKIPSALYDQLPIHIAAQRGLHHVFRRLLKADPSTALAKASTATYPMCNRSIMYHIIVSQEEYSISYASMMMDMAELCPEAFTFEEKWMEESTLLHRVLDVHYIAAVHPDVVYLCMKMLPDAVRTRDYAGDYPLNKAVRWLQRTAWSLASLENLIPIILRLAEAYPEAMTVSTEHDYAPIHFMLWNIKNVPEHFTEMLVEIINVYPEAVKLLTDRGESPLEIAVKNGLCNPIVAALFAVEPAYLMRPITPPLLVEDPGHDQPLLRDMFERRYGYNLQEIIREVGAAAGKRRMLAIKTRLG